MNKEHTNTTKTAIIIGATGLTGSILLQKLLNNDLYSKIVLFSRTPCHIKHEKLEEHLADMFKLHLYKQDFKADQLFCCIGTTKSKTPDKELYKKIDYGIVATAAKLCKQNSIPVLVVISAMGADPKSNIFYSRIKGEMEDMVMNMGIPQTYIVQPSLISGKRSEKRPGELIFKKIMSVADVFMIGGLKKYKSISPETIANAMIYLANSNLESGRFQSDRLQLMGAE